MKETIIAQKHEETINYVQDIIDRSWEVINERKRVENETLMIMNEKKVEQVNMLSEFKDPLLYLDNCSLHELINVLQKFASDPSINCHRAGLGSYIANHVLKEKIAR